MEFCFVLNDSTDGTKEGLLGFSDYCDEKEIPCTILEVNVDGIHYSREGRSSVASYSRLAVIRNMFLECFLKSDADFLFSIDSDIILNKPTYLQRMVSHNVPLVAGLIRNDYHVEEKGYRKQAFNVLNFDPKKGFYVHVLAFSEGLNECDFTGAIILIRRDVIEAGVKYGTKIPGLQGEDQSFCEAAKKKGFKIYVDTQVKPYHAMSQRQRLGLSKGIFNFKDLAKLKEEDQSL